jgi:stage II sporulation protein D
VVKGRGFGHGVGLCQEGAMKMARSGFHFEQILGFYFPGSKVRHYGELNFFKQQPYTLNFE